MVRSNTTKTMMMSAMMMKTVKKERMTMMTRKMTLALPKKMVSTPTKTKMKKTVVKQRKRRIFQLKTTPGVETTLKILPPPKNWLLPNS